MIEDHINIQRDLLAALDDLQSFVYIKDSKSRYVDEPKLLDSINTHFPDRSIHASAFSDYLCWLSLEGEAAEDALRQGGFISLANEGLPPGCARRTLMAGIPAIIYRKTAIKWTIGIERSYASYFSDWLKSQKTE